MLMVEGKKRERRSKKRKDRAHFTFTSFLLPFHPRVCFPPSNGHEPDTVLPHSPLPPSPPLLSTMAECSICLDPLFQHEPPIASSSSSQPPLLVQRKVVSLPCGHVFHDHCIQAWFDEKGRPSNWKCICNCTQKPTKATKITLFFAGNAWAEAERELNSTPSAAIKGKARALEGKVSELSVDSSGKEMQRVLGLGGVIALIQEMKRLKEDEWVELKEDEQLKVGRSSLISLFRRISHSRRALSYTIETYRYLLVPFGASFSNPKLTSHALPLPLSLSPSLQSSLVSLTSSLDALLPKLHYSYRNTSLVQTISELEATISAHQTDLDSLAKQHDLEIQELKKQALFKLNTEEERSKQQRKRDRTRLKEEQDSWKTEKRGFEQLVARMSLEKKELAR